MNERVEPDWSHLPHDPVAFFELKSGYDRRDLKRAYNRLLRIYKPEKHPQEFQKLRAAYEQLDNGLRYGESVTQQATVASYDWTTEAHKAEDDSDSQQRVQAPRVVPLSERVQVESASAIYAELSEREHRTPYDYFAMAILSDALPNPRSSRFVQALLAGLQQYPNEQGLYALLYQHFREKLPLKVIPGLLKATAKVVRTDRFYALTESLWDVVIREVSFSQFQKLLEECERSLRVFKPGAKLAFYMHILKPAIWKANSKWLDQTFAFIDENGDQIAFWMEFEVEILYRLRAYVEARDDFVTGHPLRQEMDRVLQDYCLLDSVEFDRSMIACQVKIASSQREVMNAFPLESKVDFDSATLLWSWLSSESAERSGVVVASEHDPDDSDAAAEVGMSRRKTMQRMRSLMRSIEARTNASLTGRWWSTIQIVVGLMLMAGTYILLFVGTIALGLYLNESLAIVLPVAAVMAAAGWFVNQGIGNLWSKYCLHLARKCYKSIWRTELYEFLSRTRLPLSEFGNLFVSLPEDCSEYQPLIHYCLVSDSGLDVYAQSQQFLS